MIEIIIPGLTTFQFHHLVMDVNGTIAKDGRLIEGVPPLLKELRTRLEVHMITADTHGRQEEIDRILGFEAVRIPTEHQQKAKLHYLERLGPERVFAVGNGANDALMLQRAALGVAVLGPEGAALETLCRADVVVPDICTALELLLHPKRLIATLRR